MELKSRDSHQRLIQVRKYSFRKGQRGQGSGHQPLSTECLLLTDTGLGTCHVSVVPSINAATPLHYPCLGP